MRLEEDMWSDTRSLSMEEVASLIEPFAES
jgi:hypothetical protein